MIEITGLLAKEYKYFIYGIMGGFVIYYFEKDRIGVEVFIKLFIFGLISQFSHNAVVGFEIVDITNESQMIVATMSIATSIQLVLQYISDKNHGTQIIDGILRKIGIYK